MKFWIWGGLVAALPLLSAHSAPPAPQGSAPTLTLDDSIKIAEQNAFTLRTAASNVEIAHQQINLLRGGLGPQFSASSSYSHILNHSSLSNISSLGSGASGGSGGTSGSTASTTGTTAATTGATTATSGTTATTTGSTASTTGTTAATTGTTATTGGTTSGTGGVPINQSTIGLFTDTQTATLSVALPIDISGTIRKGVRAAQASYRASRANFATADNDLRQSVKQSYFTILQDKAQIDVAQDTVTNAEATLKNAQEKLNAGTLARYDVLQYETQLSQAQSDLLTAQNNLAVAKENFNDILARPIDTPFDLAPVDTLPTVGDTPDQLVQKALNDRPEIQSFKASVEALKLQRQATEASGDPSMSVGASHSRFFQPGTFTTEFHETSAFINLSVPIFDSGITRARVKEVRQQEAQVEIQLQQAELNISLEVRQDFSNLTNASAKLEVAQKQVAQASEAYRLSVVRANAGEGTTLDVTNAQTQLTTAKTGLVNARYAYLIAYAALQRAIDADGARVPPIVPPRGGK